MTTPVTLVRGDNLGSAVLDAVQPLFGAAGANLEFREVETPEDGITPELVEAIRDTRVALMGHHWGRRDRGTLPPIVQLRKELGCFANLRPIVSRHGFDTVHADTDIWVVRETTEDIYSNLEHETLPGVYESFKVTTRAACERIARYAFDLARKRGRKKVTTVHKSNIMKQSDGMFLRTSQEVAKDYTDIEHNEVIVDALCMKLVIDPSQFDVLLCGNLFGDIVGDLGAGMVGGAVNSPSINVTSDGTAIFTLGQPLDATEGSVDPLPLLITGLYMLEHLDEFDARKRLGDAAENAVRAGVVPVSLGGEASGQAFIEAIAAHL